MSLFSSREDLAALLAPSGFQIHDHVPGGEVEPPCLVIEPADDYLRATQDWSNEYVVSYHLFLFVPLGENDVALNDIDNMFAILMPLFGEWVVDAVDRPQIYETGDWALYGSRLTVKNLTTIEGISA